MYDHSPVLIWTTNAEGNRLFFNKAWREFTGYDQPEGNAELLMRIHPDERDVVRDRFRRHFAARTPYRAEYRLKRHDGAYRWVISHAAPFFNPQGQFAGFISSCFDFNDQHEFETTLATRALKQTALATFGRFALAPHNFAELTREAVRLILETLHVDCAYLASLNAETRELKLEANACRLNKAPPRDLGVAPVEALSLTRARQLADDSATYPLASFLAANGIRSSLVCPVGAGGQLYGFLFANTRNIRSFSPEAVDFIQGLAITLNTVYQRERVEKELAASEQRLLQSQKTEAIGLLAGGIAHDFNNLLTAIHGYTELLQKEVAALPQSQAAPAAASIRAHATGIVNASDRASRLVRRLLTFSRAQEPNPERIDINLLILDLKELIAAFLRSGIQLELQLDAGPAMAFVDRSQLEQVIVNLAINARDAMPHGGRLAIGTRRLRIDGGQNPSLEPGDYAEVFITDTGTGIPPEIQKKIFTPFFTTKPKNGGTGLGLATCSNIIKNARGEISFVSAQNKGTTFIVRVPDFPEPQSDMPRGAPVTPFFEESDSGVMPPAPAAAAPGAPDAGELPMGTETIMLVEDDSAIRDVTTVILESLGYTVWAYASGEELLSADAAMPSAQLLITDLNMPGISGRQLAERVCAKNPGLSVLYISGFITDAVRQSGAHFLEKPFTREILAQKVRRTLGK